MEEFIRSPSNIEKLTLNAVENGLLADEEIPDYAPSLDDDSYTDDWSFGDSVDIEDEEPFQKKWEDSFCDSVTSITGSELPDYFTPHGLKRSIHDEDSRKRAKWDDCNETCTHREQNTPLPFLTWVDSKTMWDIMVHKSDAIARTRNGRLFEITDTIVPRMRAILVEWLMEVCEVYKLRRSTFYLAVDYVDRYLSINPHVPKNQLQLLGVSAIYIASKFDEIYSPKVNEFAYVCDGACSENDILRCERLLLNVLSWDINPMTPTTWLSLFMQIHFNSKNALNHNLVFEFDISNFFLFPRYSSFDFVKASHLIDLLSLDPCYLLFNYNVIAASAMYFLYGRACALKCSGLEWKDIETCVEYMSTFYTLLRDSDDPKLNSVPTIEPIDRRDHATYNFLKHRIPDITYGENHFMQTRCINLDYFEKSCVLRLERMGFRVRKVPNNENKQEAEASTANPENNGENETEKRNESVSMYEAERDRSSVSSSCTDCPVGTTPSPQSDINMEFFEWKSQFTLDELIERINDYTIQKVMVPSILCDEANENTNAVPD